MTITAEPTQAEKAEALAWFNEIMQTPTMHFVAMHTKGITETIRRALSVRPAITTWQTIETAPKDGTSIMLWDTMLWDTGHVFVGYWNKGWHEFGSSEVREDNISHWMPLPDPPLK